MLTALLIAEATKSDNRIVGEEIVVVPGSCNWFANLVNKLMGLPKDAVIVTRTLRRE